MQIELLKVWTRVAALSLAATLFAVVFVDSSVANYCVRGLPFPVLYQDAPSSLLIAGVLAVGMAGIAIYCLSIWDVPRWAQAVLLSGIAAVASLYLTERLVKPLFSRPDPITYVYHLRHTFGWYSPNLVISSFPSTHAALGAAAISVLGLYFPRLRFAGVVVVVVIDTLLVLGSWHFVSDVIAGSLLGFTIALIAYSAVETLKKRAHRPSN